MCNLGSPSELFWTRFKCLCSCGFVTMGPTLLTSPTNALKLCYFTLYQSRQTDVLYWIQIFMFLVCGWGVGIPDRPKTAMIGRPNLSEMIITLRNEEQLFFVTFRSSSLYFSFVWPDSCWNVQLLINIHAPKIALRFNSIRKINK